MAIPPHSMAELEKHAQAGDVRAQYTLSALLGRMGRKEESRVWLAKAASGGDLEAQYTRACLFLDGVDGPRNTKLAVEMLRETADRGGMAALRTLAVLTALGIERTASMSDAIMLLRRAAGDGDTASIAQLRLIEQGSFSKPIPPKSELSRAPNAWRMDQLLTPDECHHLVEAVTPYQHPSYVIDPQTGQTFRSTLRTSKTATVHPFQQDLVMHLINQRLSDAAGLSLEQGEMLGVLMYEVGEQYRPHFDFLDPTAGASSQFGSAGQRIATLLVSLNDDFDGGETHFLSNKLNWRGKTGDALLFWNVDGDGKPDPTTRHAGNPVTRGTKYLLSKWFREKPVAF
ncbi:MAG: 2OG-Fe(II) oxygenase [Micropepsaceae bacterium]